MSFFAVVSGWFLEMSYLQGMIFHVHDDIAIYCIRIAKLSGAKNGHYTGFSTYLDNPLQKESSRNHESFKTCWKWRVWWRSWVICLIISHHFLVGMCWVYSFGPCRAEHSSSMLRPSVSPLETCTACIFQGRSCLVAPAGIFRAEKRPASAWKGIFPNAWSVDDEFLMKLSLAKTTSMENPPKDQRLSSEKDEEIW